MRRAAVDHQNGEEIEQRALFDRQPPVHIGLAHREGRVPQHGAGYGGVVQANHDRGPARTFYAVCAAARVDNRQPAEFDEPA